MLTLSLCTVHTLTFYLFTLHTFIHRHFTPYTMQLALVRSVVSLIKQPNQRDYLFFLDCSWRHLIYHCVRPAFPGICWKMAAQLDAAIVWLHLRANHLCASLTIITEVQKQFTWSFASQNLHFSNSCHIECSDTADWKLKFRCTWFQALVIFAVVVVRAFGVCMICSCVTYMNSVELT